MIIEIVIINFVRKRFFYLKGKNNEVNTLLSDIGLIVSGKKKLPFQYCIFVMMKK